MKRLRFFILLALIMSITNSANSHSIEEIRKTYQLAVESPSVTEKLSSDLKKIKKPDPLTLAYIASVEALKAKHSWNPYSKLSYMTNFDKLMGDAIKQNPDNMEIRFLRYTIQYYTPSFLGYSKNLEEDKRLIVDSFLKKKFVSNNKKLIKEVYDFMLHTNSLTPAEKLKMEKIIQQL